MAKPKRPVPKKPASIPEPVHHQGNSTSADDKALQDRSQFKEFSASLGPLPESPSNATERHQSLNTLEQVQHALAFHGKKRRVGEVALTPSKQKALLKLDPYDSGVLTQVIRDPEAYSEVLEAVWLQSREACAKFALQDSRRRLLAGDSVGADVARQIAMFIQQIADQKMES